MNAYSQKMVMKREVLADKAIWTAKKRYSLMFTTQKEFSLRNLRSKLWVLRWSSRVHLQLFVESCVIRFKLSSQGIKKIYIHMLWSLEKSLINYRFKRLLSRRGVNGLKQYAGSPIYTKGTPIHVRGALLFNHHCKRMGIEKKYQPIRDGDKIRFVYVRTPNPFQEDVIAFPQVLPKEFKLETYIDYDKMFEKVFLDALQIVIEPLGWKTQEESSLEDFFG
jgi:hypothetical protein